MSENIDIKIREDGSRVVARNLEAAASASDKADRSIKSLNKSIGSGTAQESALTKLKALVRMAEGYGAGLTRSLDQTTSSYRNSLMRHFEMVSKDARASAASIKSQMEAITAVPVNMSAMNAFYAKQEALDREYTVYLAGEMAVRQKEEIASSAARLKAVSASMATRMKEESAYTAFWVSELKKRDAAQAASALRNAEQRSATQAFSVAKMNKQLIAPDQGTSELAKFYAAQSKMNTGAKTSLETANYQAMQRQAALMQLMLPMAERQLMLDNEADAVTKRLNVAKNTLANTHGKLATAARSGGDSQQFWNQKATDAHALARGLSGSLGQLWLTYGSILPLLAGAALGSAFVGAAKAGSELSYSLQFVKSLGGESQQAIDKLRESSIALGKESQFGPVQIADGYRILAQAGLNAADALQVMPNVLALATTGEMTMEQAGLALVGVLNAFNLKITDSQHVTDVFAKAAAVSQTSVVQMTEAMKTASTVGQQYHQSMEGTATALALLAKVNITGTAAGTSFKNMLKEMYAPTAAIRKEWKALGIEMETTVTDKFGKTSKKVRDFADVVYDLKKKMESLDQPSQLRLSSFLSNERGSKELVAMLNLSREEWDKFYNDISNKSEGFAKKVAEDLNRTAKGEWKIALNVLQAQLTDTFHDMEPQFISLANKFKAAFESEEFKSAISNVVTLLLQITTTLVDLAPVLYEVAKAWLVLKAATVTMALVEGVAAGFVILTNAVRGAQMLMATFSAVAAGTATTLAGGSGVVAALGLLSNPLGWILGLLAAGAAAWALWGNAAETAAGKAIKTSQDRLNQLKNEKIFGASEAGKAREELAKREGELAKLQADYDAKQARSDSFTNSRSMRAITIPRGALDEVRKSVEIQKELVGALEEREKAATKLAKVDVPKIEQPKYGTDVWNPPEKSKKGGLGPSGRLEKDDTALAKLKASLQASQQEFETIEKTGEAQFKLNAGQQKSLEIQNKINELQNKSSADIKEKGMAGRAEQLKNLNEQLVVANQLGEQLKKNEMLKVNVKLDEEVRMSQLLPLAREQENKFITFRNELLQKGVILDEAAEASLRKRINDQIELNKVLTQRDQFLQNSDAQKNKDFTTKAEGLDKASKTQEWTQNDTNKNTMDMLTGMGVDTSKFKETQSVQLAQLESYYGQVQALRDKDLISEETYQNAKSQLEIKSQEIRLSGMTGFFGTLAGLQNSGNSRLAAIGKAAAISQATMDGVVAVQKAYAGSPYPWNIAAAAAQAAISAANVAKISGLNFATGGSFVVGGTGGVDSQNVAFRASPGERVSVATPTQVRKGTEQNSQDQNTGKSPTIMNIYLPPGSKEDTRRAAGQGAREGLAVMNSAARYK